MTGFTSSIPAAMSALVTVLQGVAAAGGLATGMLVVDGDMGTNSPQLWVELGGAANWKQEPAGLGNYRRDESYDLEALVNLYDGGTGPDVAPTVRANAFGILELIILAIAADPTLGGTVRFAQCMGGGDMTQGATVIGGWAVQVPFVINCEVQLER